MSTLYSALPSMNILLQNIAPECQNIPRTIQKKAMESLLITLRNDINNSTISSIQELNKKLETENLVRFCSTYAKPHFTRIINATGVILHTNAGRALLSENAIEAVIKACAFYSNLELNLNTGTRGSRYSHVEELLCDITGAESAIVVNNNAAAVLLFLDSLCAGGEVIVSRGQLVEIGGSFRIPDVMQRSGALLKEVGTTNRTHIHDYENAICENTRALLKVHTSNFKVIGFTHTVSTEDLVTLGKKYNIPVLEDVGSGSLYSLTKYGFSYEPTVQELISAGADIVSFSGDKVLGGPQAGIIVGKKCYIDIIKKNQLTRALRIDKMTLAALEATLSLYLDEETLLEKNPTLAMLTIPLTALQEKAESLLHLLTPIFDSIATLSCITGNSRVGGGSFPEENLPTVLLAIHCNSVDITLFSKILLQTSTPVLTRIEHNVLLLDVRTIQKEEFTLLVSSMQEAIALQ
ncbi:MAG: L-seryl-tRNA(Sec) selenium transferase [Desulfovibrionaceae bacterium]